MAEFFYMGGYGFYVWMSMGFTALIMLAEIVSLRLTLSRILKRLGTAARLRKNA